MQGIQRARALKQRTTHDRATRETGAWRGCNPRTQAKGRACKAVLDTVGGEQKGFGLSGIVPAQAKQFPPHGHLRGCRLCLLKARGLWYDWSIGSEYSGTERSKKCLCKSPLKCRTTSWSNWARAPKCIFARCAVFGRFCKHDSSSMKNNSAAAGLLCLWLYAGCAIQRAGPQKNSVLPEKFSGATPLEWSQRLADSE